MPPEAVARVALRNLGRRGSVVTGVFNKISAFLLARFTGRALRTRLMGRMTKPRL